MICYFCKQCLVKSDAIIGRYERYHCNACIITITPYTAGVPKYTYHIAVNEEHKPTILYLYFVNINLSLSIYYSNYNLKGFMDIRNEKNSFILRLEETLNPFDYQPNLLANRIKNWILFS